MIKGIYPPITTPFINDEPAFDKLEFNINLWNKTSLGGYVVLGSNGESVFLTFDEKIKLVENAANFAGSYKLIIAGTGSDSIKETIRLTNEAVKVGADYALVLTPSFYKNKMNDAAMKDYFDEVADSVTIPVIIYNVPKFTGVSITVDAVSFLSQHENIVGIKNSSEDVSELKQFVGNTPDNFSVLVGTASVLYPGLAAGASGGIIALANIAAAECLEIYNKFMKGEHKKAELLQEKLIKVNTAITVKFGVAGLKAAMDMLGFFGGLPRKPLQSLELKEIESIKKILIKASLL